MKAIENVNNALAAAQKQIAAATNQLNVLQAQQQQQKEQQLTNYQEHTLRLLNSGEQFEVTYYNISINYAKYKIGFVYHSEGTAMYPTITVNKVMRVPLGVKIEDILTAIENYNSNDDNEIFDILRNGYKNAL